ncbi:hypothetical protein [Geomicrobium sp. JCM 19055]|uniref:hypothetical protein n=1 Tax=Geomicrobium sp. JCM 19055 TaxID=1460649 RepID=UPI0005A87A16|nr:hypothetical protein [Geomicrobium sp. JCM 19055]
MIGIDLVDFLEKAEKATLNGEMHWEPAPTGARKRLIQPEINYERLNNIYISTNSNGKLVAVGSYDEKKYYDVDEYNFENEYFLSFTNKGYQDVLTFIRDESTDDNLSVDFQIKLGKLLRIVQIQSTNLKENIDTWFN